MYSIFRTEKNAVEVVDTKPPLGRGARPRIAYRPWWPGRWGVVSVDVAVRGVPQEGPKRRRRE